MVFKSVYIRILILMVTEYGQDPYSDGHWIVNTVMIGQDPYPDGNRIPVRARSCMDP